MSNLYESHSRNRRVDGPRNYRVYLTLFGPHASGGYRPSQLTVHIAATSSMQARMNAEGGYPGYTVTSVVEA